MKYTFLKLIMVSSISALLLTACMKKEKPEDAEQEQTTQTEVQESDFQELDNGQEQAEYTDLEEINEDSGTAEITASEQDAYADPTPAPNSSTTSSNSSSSNSNSSSSTSSANSANTVSEDVINDEHALSGDATEDDAVAAAMKAAQPALQ